MANRFLGLGSGKSGAIALGSYTQTWYSCSGSSGATSLSVTGTFSPGDRIFIHQTRGTGVGGYEDNTVASYTTGTITLVHPLLQTYTDSGASQAQVAVVKEATSVSGSFTVGAWDGDVGGIFVMACNGTFSGTVNATGKGYRGGRNGANPNPSADNTPGEQGEGYVGAASRTYTANGNGGGGGEARTSNEQGNGGGGGAYVSAGLAGLGSGPGQVGQGGLAVGGAALTALYFGGGGGGGGFGDSEGSSNLGNGGAGGGIIVIYAAAVSNSASLVANGVKGEDGLNDRGAGGGGAGGSILIKTRSITTGTITALETAAAGGTSGGGGNGSAGRVRIETCSLSGTTSPSASTQTGGFNYCGTNIAIL